MNEVKRKIRDALLTLVAICAIAYLIIAGLHTMTAAVSVDALRWWATGATLAVPVIGGLCWSLATRSAREHLSGFERGLTGAERAMQTVGRGLSAAASMARAARASPAPAQHDDLLPRIGQMRIVEPPHSAGEIIDL